MASKTSIIIQGISGGAAITKDGRNLNLSAGEALVIESDGSVRVQLASGGSLPAAPVEVKPTEITVEKGEGLRSAVITKNGAEIAIPPGDSIVIAASGAITHKGPGAPEPEPEKPLPEVGDVMPDGTIYAGLSPTNCRPMYAVPFDAPLLMSFGKAVKYAQNLTFGGKKDYRLPDIYELKSLCDNQNRGALSRTFNTSSRKGKFYWSSTTESFKSMFVRMDNGVQDKYKRSDPSSVRCIRYG
jgi:hypothetical protein